MSEARLHAVQIWQPEIAQRFLDALHAGRLTTPETVHFIDTHGSGALLLRALAYLERGQLQAAALDVERALSVLDDPAQALAVSIIEFVLRRYDTCLRRLESLRNDARAGRRALKLAALMALRVGWEQEARQLLGELIAREPDVARWQLEVAQLHARRRSFDDAILHMRRALDLAPGNTRLMIELGALSSCAGRLDEASSAVESALRLNPRELPVLLEAARIASDAGAFDLAARCLDNARTLDAAACAPLVMLAELAGWRGDVDACTMLARQALDREATCAGAIRVLAALDAQAGRYVVALEGLNRANELDPSDPLALVWRAEVQLRLGQPQAARDDLSAATTLHADFSLPIALLWLLARTDLVYDGATLEAAREGLLELCPSAASTLDAANPDAIREVVEDALRKLGGNRSAMPTLVRDGRLVRLRVRTAPRHAARRALELITVLPPERVRRELQAVAERFPDSALPQAHLGELELWLGNLDGAREALERAIAMHERTRWAYIGLAGVAMLEGRLEDALEVCALGVARMGHTQGPAVFAYRGEVLRRSGRLEAALADIDASLAHSPSRLSSHINRALLCDALGQPAEAKRMFAQVRELAPTLVSDAGLETGHEAWEADMHPDHRICILEHALTMMRGNRSSTCVTYFTADGRLRYVVRAGTSASARRERDDLARARGLLMASIGTRTRKRSPV